MDAATSSVTLTHPDRVLYTRQGITKRDLADYYMKIADWVLPHVRGRILTLVRCPAGEGAECFFQKHPFSGLPEQVRAIPIEEKTKSSDYMVIDDIMGLVALVQHGALEIHTWGAPANAPERPDRLIFDLDPGSGVSWSDVVRAARKLRELLTDLGLTAFVKTSGIKGLHVVAPIRQGPNWEQVREFCKGVAQKMENLAPDRYVATMSKAQRRERIFVDYLRNARGATTVCAYSTRAKPQAPVSTPLAWDEIGRSVADHYTVKNLPRRLAALESDPWKGFFQLRQSI